jgi:predicted RNase H-like nuclease (RuvC/YqgF family)
LPGSRVNKFANKFLHISKYCRLLELEDSVKSLELIRLDLTTVNVELQERVVRVQEHNEELQKRLVEEQDNKRIEDLAHQLDDANKQIVKLKAQQKSKVKNLTKQLDGLKKVRGHLEQTDGGKPYRVHL